MPLRHLHLLLLGLITAAMPPVSGCLPRPAPPVVVAGELHGDLTWAGEVLIGGDVTLAAGSRLTILPGTVVRFLAAADPVGGAGDHPHFPGHELNVAGTLSAVGTAAAPITFAAADDQAPAGSWGAVNFAEGSQGWFRHCIFRQADSAIHGREATIEVAESLIEDNLVGIRFHTSAMRIEHNLLRRNETAIRFHYGAPVVRDNRFEENRVNLFITAHPLDYLFARNHFGRAAEYQVVLGEDVPEDVALSGNRWDDGSAAAVLERVFDGRRVSYLGRVQVEPLLETIPEGSGPSWTR